MSKWRVILWCNDCAGVDSQGCFDGGSGSLDEVFDTKEEAEAAGKKACDGPPWSYEVSEVRPSDPELELERRLAVAWREFYGSPAGGTPSIVELAYKPLRELLREAARIGAEAARGPIADMVEAEFARYDVAHAIRNWSAK